jgi:hypothetical protein
MLSPEEIAEQQQLLATYRHTLAIYLKQQAMIGPAYSPPALIGGIDEARSTIRRIKATLRAAGVVVDEDPDDEPSGSTFVGQVAVPPPRRSRQFWVWLIAVDMLALVLVIGGVWWFTRTPGNTPSLEATRTVPEEATPPQDTPSGQTDLAALESQLMDANIALSAVQVEQVRKFINEPDTGYKLLAEHALEVIGDQKFQDMLYLDELDTQYTELVGQDHYLDFDEDQLKEAMVRVWNDHYPDRQVASFEQIIQSRS